MSDSDIQLLQKYRREERTVVTGRRCHRRFTVMSAEFFTYLSSTTRGMLDL